jgi:membrane-associated phospholipid phosphatase
MITSLKKRPYFLWLIAQFTIITALWPAGLKAQVVKDRLDDRILLNLAQNRTPGQTKIFLFVSRTNNLVNAGIPVGLFTAGVISGDKQMRQNAFYMASSSVVNLLATTGLKLLIKRRRPYIRNLRIVSVYPAEHYSFPSGHTSSAFTTATALSTAYPKWYVIAPSFLWASSVGYSRMYLGVHYPTDVAAGAVLGATTAYSLKFIR